MPLDCKSSFILQPKYLSSIGLRFTIVPYNYSNMLKGLVIAVVCLICSANVIAHPNDPDSLKQRRPLITGELTLGSAVPVADFYPSNKNSGYAQPGFALSFQGNYFLKPQLGVHFKGGFLLNNFNQYDFREDQLEGESFQDLSLTTGSYKTLYLTAGPTYRIPLEWLTVQVHAGIGYLYEHDPKIDETRIFGSGYRSWTEKASGEGNAMAFNVGGQMLFELNSRLDLSFGVDYLVAKPGIQADNTTGSFDPDSDQTIENSDTEEYRLLISSLNISAGVAYRFKW